ncbi:DUF6640 family protein [Nocardia sp. NPDC050406]|uniref:DUF6640 family protein n=1 Tax=Nocardia sp. NPDC050406 TaxID=3364318 RepID=UPI00378C6E30
MKRLPRVLVGVVLLFALLGPLLADLVIPDVAALHLHNPAWPPHAKFHDAQYIVMSALLGVVGFTLLLRPGGEPRRRFHIAAALASITWLGMFGALLFPGTAPIDPEFEADNQLLLGLDAQLFIALVMLVTLAVALLAERLATRE